MALNRRYSTCTVRDIFRSEGGEGAHGFHGRPGQCRWWWVGCQAVDQPNHRLSDAPLTSEAGLNDVLPVPVSPEALPGSMTREPHAVKPPTLSLATPTTRLLRALPACGM